MNDHIRNHNEQSPERKIAEPISRRLFETGQGEIILNQAIQMVPEDPVVASLPPSNLAGRVAMEALDQKPQELENTSIAPEKVSTPDNHDVDDLLQENVIDEDHYNRIVEARRHVEKLREAA